MKKSTKNKAFTLVEIVVVITILTILRTVAFVSYEGQLLSSRNTARESDLLGLSTSLKSHKLKNGRYPNPGDYFNTSYNGTVVAKQGFMNDKVYSTEIVKKPLDSFHKIPYFYSITKNNKFFQLSSIIEPTNDNEVTKAYLYGDYQTVAKDILPTIMLATSARANANIEIASGTINGNVNRKLFIVNKGTLNLPYTDIDTRPVSTRSTFESILSETGSDFSQYPGYSSCLEIYEAGRSIGSGSYQILDNNGAVTSTGCSMVFGAQPYVRGTPYIKGQSFIFDGLTWYVSANSKVAYTKDAGANDFPNNLADSDNILVFDNGQTLTKGTNAFILRTVNQGATQVYNYGTTYSGTPSRYWNEGATTNYGADTTTRQASYTADKAMLGDYYQWGRNDAVSLLPTTTTLYSAGGYQTGGINISGTNFIINATTPYSWMNATQHNSSSTVVWTDTSTSGVCPSDYHLPTTSTTVGSGEWRKVVELVTGLTVSWTTTERGNLQKYLLLPMAGNRYLSGTFNSQGSNGYYWSSSINGNSGYYISLYYSGIDPSNFNNRTSGFSVRCFKN